MWSDARLTPVSTDCNTLYSKRIVHLCATHRSHLCHAMTPPSGSGHHKLSRRWRLHEHRLPRFGVMKANAPRVQQHA